MIKFNKTNFSFKLKNDLKKHSHEINCNGKMTMTEVNQIRKKLSNEHKLRRKISSQISSQVFHVDFSLF